VSENSDAVEHGKDEEVLSEEEKRERERQDLLEQVSSFNLRTIKHKVAWILNHYPETRDSDITLQLRYWATFQPNLYPGGDIAPENYYDLARLTSLTRARAKIQNEYKLFQASTPVRKRRGTLAEEEKERAVEDKPAAPMYAIYMDDSGKHGEYLIVGSVWFLAKFRHTYQALHALSEDFGKEFHFAHASRYDEPHYIKLIDTLYSLGDAVSFKYISVRRKGLRGNDPFTDLYYHILVKGIKHENDTGRASLPRRMQSWIDAENVEMDQLRLANLTDRLKQAASSHFDNNLYVEILNTANSKTSVTMQVADLIAASVNRVLNHPGNNPNHKDTIANYACEKFGIVPDVNPNDQVGDMTIHIAL
jgi:hypothetical protein